MSQASYITKYIVDNTLGVMLGELEDKLEEVEESGDIDALTEILAQATDIKILDPACGSGAFLIQALKLLRDFYDTYSEVAEERRKKHPTDNLIDSGELTNKIDPIAYGNRRKSVRLSKAPGYYALQHNIYGVDIDERAVEVTAVSLMMQILDEVKDAPGLKFPAIMEENIKCGNSLISGVTNRKELEEDFKEEIGELIALRKQHKSETDSEKKAALFLQIDHKKRPINLKLNSKLSEYFDDVNAKKPFNWEIEFPEVFFEIVSERSGRALSRPESGRSPSRPVSSREGTAVSPILASQPDGEIAGGRFSGLRRRHLNDKFSQAQLQAKSSTHCVLKENPGFDCVVGNPPYGDILDTRTKNYLEAIGVPKTGGRAEIYATFIIRGLRQLAPSRPLSFITPNTLLDGAQFTGLRQTLSDEATLARVKDYRNLSVFDDASVQTMVAIWYKAVPSTDYIAPYEYWDAKDEQFKSGQLSIAARSDLPWRMQTSVTKRVNKPGLCIPLEPGIGICRDAGVDYKWKGVGWQKRGEKTKMSDLLFYEGEKRHKDDFPLLKGADINQYSLNFNDNWLIHDFERYRTEASVVLVYLDLALVPVKILTRQTSDRIQACIDYEQHVTAKSIHTTIVKAENYNPLYVIAVLNSKLLSHVYQVQTGESGRLFAQIKLYDFRELPICRIDFTNPTEESQHDELAALADKMLHLNKRLHNELEQLPFLQVSDEINPSRLPLKEMGDRFRIAIRKPKASVSKANTGSKRKKLTPKVIESFEVRDGELRLKDGKLTARIRCCCFFCRYTPP